MLTIDLESTFTVKSLLIEKNNLNLKYSHLIKLDTIGFAPFDIPSIDMRIYS